jgi:predicted transcriptional regulator
MRFSPEIEAELARRAATTGREPSEVAEELITTVLANEARFLAGVERGRQAAARGDFVDHQEVVERVERIIRS